VDGEWNKPPRFKNVCVAASITGWVRAFLWRSLLTVDRPVYCDTDSIICEAYEGLVIGKDLGEWDIEGENMTKLAIAGKKLYATFQGSVPYKKACKGGKLECADIEEVARGTEVRYDFESPTFSISRAPSFISRRINQTQNDVKLSCFLRDRKKGKIIAEKLVDSDKSPVKLRIQLNHPIFTKEK